MKKSFLVTELLCVLFGCLGVHRYYTGYIGLGILQTLTFGCCGIWSTIDLIFISLNKYQDANGQDLEDYNEKIGIGVIIIMLALTLISVFGPKVIFSNTNINNSINSSQSAKQEMQFSNATCTYDAHSYFCNGILSDDEKDRLKEAQKSLR